MLQKLVLIEGYKTLKIKRTLINIELIVARVIKDLDLDTFIHCPCEDFSIM